MDELIYNQAVRRPTPVGHPLQLSWRHKVKTPILGGMATVPLVRLTRPAGPSAWVRSALWSSVILSALPGGWGCNGGDQQAGGVIHELRGDATRVPARAEAPNSASDDTWTFGWKFYAEEADKGENVFFSPYSISAVGAMLVAGASGETKSEIDAALSFSSDDGPAFHQARNSLAQALEARNHRAAPNSGAQSLRVSNDLWLDSQVRPSASFLDTLSAYYGAGTFLAPFATDAEQARIAINAKVARDTQQLIGELLPPGSVNENAALVITNALYFKANWATPFSHADTSLASFTNALGETATVPMMQLSLEARYVGGPGYEAIALPYSHGEVELVAIMPTAGTFAAFTDSLSADSISAISGSLRTTELNLRFPKLELATKVSLKQRLQGLGMQRAFEQGAEFERLLPSPPVHISEAFHDATLRIDEGGTEAAAATAVVVVVDITPPPDPTGFPVVFDHPFLFFIRDVQTNALLFVGHVDMP